MVELLQLLAAALVPAVLVVGLGVLFPLGRRFVVYGRQARAAEEDARVLAALISEGYSPAEADDAVLSTQKDDPDT